MTQSWEPGTAYNHGDIVEYEGHSYKLIQPHTSQSDFAPALWGRLSDQDGPHSQESPQQWQQQGNPNKCRPDEKHQDYNAPPPQQPATSVPVPPSRLLRGMAGTGWLWARDVWHAWTGYFEKSLKALVNLRVQPGHGHRQHTAPPGRALSLWDWIARPPEHAFWDWIARIEFKTYELECNFAVVVFLGGVPEDPEDWQCCDTYVGAAHTYINSAEARRANSSGQGDFVEQGFVHLNPGIAQHSGLSSFEPKVVEPYLARALEWRVQKMDGTCAELKSLEVRVFVAPLSYPPGTKLSVAGEPCYYNGITHGRPGGCRSA